MAKVIKKKMDGMNWWMKTGLVLLLLLPAIGLYNPTEASAVTYYVTGNTTTALGADGTSNLPTATSTTSAATATSTTPVMRGVFSTALTTAATWTPSALAAAPMSYLKVYGPVYANATNISGITASFALRGVTNASTYTFHLYDYDPAGAAQNKTLVATSSTVTTTGGVTTTAYTPTYTISGSGTIAAGHRLMCEIVRVSGTAGATSRIAYNAGAATTGSWIILSETSADSTPPTVGNVTITPDISSTFTSAAPTITAVFTDAQSAVTSCEYTTNGTTWVTVAGGATGTGPTYTCTAKPTALSGFLSINMRATSTGGTTTATQIQRTVDTSVPTDGTLTVTAGNAINAISWTAATDTGGSGIASYVLQFATGATAPASCSVGTAVPGSPFSAATLSTTHTGLVNGTQYSYRLCATDNLGNTTGGVTKTATPKTGPVTTISNCNGCHGYKAPYTFTDGTAKNTPPGLFQGSHNTHVTGQVMDCASCHIAPATETTADNSHSDHRIQMATSISGGTYSVASPITVSNVFSPGSCNSTSCHANVYGTSGGTSPVWGTSATGCAACHTVTLGVNGPATGSHGIASGGHNVACITCHTAGTAQTVAPAVGHADGNIDTANVGYPADKTKGSAGASCSTASCHANPVSAGLVATPNWGTTNNGCAACHSGANAITATGPATGSHALPGHAAACTSCHTAGTSATVAPGVGHADGDIDVANVGYATLNKTKGSAGATCSTASCHASPVAASTIVTPAWGTTANGCAACHSGVNAITATGPATGSHALPGHAAACTSCHTAGTSATVAPGVGHADGDIDVANVGYATLNKTKGSAGATCSTASCHASPVAASTIVTPAWGTTANGCAACHSGVNAITATGPATGSHALPGHAAACTSCHTAGTSATVAPGVGHADGDIDVANVGYATLNKAKGTTGTTCSAASCHVSPVSAALIATPNWGSTGNGCVACHTGANAITATGPATGSHALPGHAAACTSCHTAGTSATV
ncbi:MAG: CxxxxCH/CxxCH domain c-type cytochrome, partial [Desulfuromonadaceae bacterium]